jgi:hypothetical protein
MHVLIVSLKFIQLFIECPWSAPNLYYADPSSRSCVLRCPSTPSLYADDLLQKCVDSKIYIYKIKNIKPVHGMLMTP